LPYFCFVSKVDYIIVGLGLAGIAFCEQCLAAGKTFMVFDKGVEGASRVAAGLYNPVILKRYSLPWKAVSQFDLAIPYFKKLEEKLDTQFMYPMAVRKVFHSIEDQNNWFAASDKQGLERFVKTPLVKNENKDIQAPYDYGEVLETGRVDIKALQHAYENYLEGMSAFAKAEFNYAQLTLTDAGVQYQDYEATHIIFAEGYGIKQNPYFNRLPLVGNKGEYIIIKAPKLKLTAAIKTSFFIVPLGEDLYKVGATYNWTDKDWESTQIACEELESKFAALVNTPYEVVGQEAGIRPTTGDRRPLLGVHPAYKQLAVLNGLGTRGIMAGPLLAQHLFEFIEKNISLPEEVDIMRFPKKLEI
jgi:glycine oxidase